MIAARGRLLCSLSDSFPSSTAKQHVRRTGVSAVPHNTTSLAPARYRPHLADSGACIGIWLVASTTLFVGRINASTRQADIEDMFGKYGRISRCYVKEKGPQSCQPSIDTHSPQQMGERDCVCLTVLSNCCCTACVLLQMRS